MIWHLALDTVMEGALGMGLDIVGTSARLLRAGRVALPRRVKPLEQRVVSMDGKPVHDVQHRPVHVEGALSLRQVRAGDVLVLPGLFATMDSSVDCILSTSEMYEVIDFTVIVGRLYSSVSDGMIRFTVEGSGRCWVTVVPGPRFG